jgi:hypothetical protein
MTLFACVCLCFRTVTWCIPGPTVGSTGCGQPSARRPWRYGPGVTQHPTDPDWLDGDAVARLVAAERDELDGEVGERSRADTARVTLADRWRSAQGRPVEADLLGGHRAAGVVAESGRDWVWLAAGHRAVVLRADAVVCVAGLGRGVSDAPDPSSGRTEVGPGHALRRLAAARRPLRLLLVDGTSRTGTPVAVGADAVELVRHPADRPVRADDPRVVVPWSALAALVTL